jgi:hypothetical protein
MRQVQNTKRAPSAIAGLGVVGGGAEYVGAQVVTRDRAVRGLFNGNAALGRNAALAPVVDVLRQHAEASRQLRGAARDFACQLDGFHARIGTRGL